MTNFLLKNTDNNVENELKVGHVYLRLLIAEKCKAKHIFPRQVSLKELDSKIAEIERALYSISHSKDKSRPENSLRVKKTNE